MKMRVKVPTKLRVRTEPSLCGRIVSILDNKAVIDVGEKIETADGVWYRLEAIYFPTKSKSGFPITWEKHIIDEERKIKVRNPRWVCGKYLRRLWWKKAYKLYG